jgi:transcriptional regulator with XRE-family HTH domain
MQVVGVYLRGLREQAELTQEQAAALVGMAGKTIERWEAGKHEPHATTLKRYVKALGGSANRVVELLIGKGEEGQPEFLPTPEELELLSQFKNLSPQQRTALRQFLRTILDE